MIAMSDQTQLTTEVLSAINSEVADAEISSIEAQDDGSVHFEVNRVTPEKRMMSTQPDTGSEDVTESDTTTDDEGSHADNMSDESATPENTGFMWGKTGQTEADEAQTGENWDDVNWPEIQKIARITEEKSGDARPDDRTKDSLTEYLESKDITPEFINDAKEQENTTNDTKSDDEPTESEDDTETDSNTPKGGMSRQELLNNGVTEKYVESCMEHRAENGECVEDDCYWGATDDSPYCASDKPSDKKGKNNDDESENKSSPKSERKLSDLNEAETKRVDYLIDEEGKDVAEAISMV